MASTIAAMLTTTPSASQGTNDRGELRSPASEAGATGFVVVTGSPPVVVGRIAAGWRSGGDTTQPSGAGGSTRTATKWIRNGDATWLTVTVR